MWSVRACNRYRAAISSRRQPALIDADLQGGGRRAGGRTGRKPGLIRSHREGGAGLRRRTNRHVLRRWRWSTGTRLKRKASRGEDQAGCRWLNGDLEPAPRRTAGTVSYAHGDVVGNRSATRIRE